MVEPFEVNIEEYKQKIINELRSTKREGIEELIKALNKTDFFEAPASTRFHMNVPGGLAYHSWMVYKLLDAKNKLYKLNLPQDSVIITALLHDLCKANLYVKSMVNVKDPNTGKWSTKPGYHYNDNLPLGHGEKSCIMLQKYIKLSRKEQLMIRWHMLFTEDKTQYNSINRALQLCPEVGALHTADCESGWFFEFIKE